MIKKILILTLLFSNISIYANEQFYVLEKGEGELKGYMVICVAGIVVLSHPRGGMIQLYTSGRTSSPFACYDYERYYLDKN
mgnify:CR=1 FL=1|tara:strand:- start:29 stop:271 length:243 start_codon:yes stop_codon:yes gene_type:complete